MSQDNGERYYTVITFSPREDRVKARSPKDAMYTARLLHQEWARAGDGTEIRPFILRVDPA